MRTAFGYVGALALLAIPFGLAYVVFAFSRNADAAAYSLLAGIVVMLALVLRQNGQLFLSSLWQVAGAFALMVASAWLVPHFLAGFFGFR